MTKEFDMSIGWLRTPLYYPDASSASSLFLTTLLLLFAATLSLKYTTTLGTTRYKSNFILYTCGLLVLVQGYHLTYAVLKVPVDFREDAHRLKCLDSGEGGKRVRGNEQEHSINPCFCTIGATCFLDASDSDSVQNPFDLSIAPQRQFNVEQIALNASNPFTSANCIARPKATCKILGSTIKRFAPSERGCASARHGTCSESEPCVPCGVKNRAIFGADRWDRCTLCTSDNRGDCKFVKGKGPYCFKGPDSREVGPCEKCCTGSELFFEQDTEGVNNKCF